MVTYFYQERADPSNYIVTTSVVPGIPWLQTVSQSAEPQWKSNYTTHVDVTNYLKNAVDISWMNSNSGVIIRPIVQVYSQRADVKWFLTIATAPDLSWIQTGYQ